MSSTIYSDYWRRLLSDNSLGAEETFFLDRGNVGVGPQFLDLRLGEITSEAVDDVPLVGGRERAYVGFTVNTILEGDNVSPCNGLLGLPNLDEGRRGGESGESAESENEEVLGEHADDAGLCGRCRKEGGGTWK